MSFLIIKGLKGQQLNARDIEAIRTRSIDGLIPVEVENKGKKCKLTYNTTGYINLNQYLATPINKEIFTMMIENIFTIFQTMKKKYYDTKCLLLNFKYIMVNPSTKKINFIYVPFQFYDNAKPIKDFYLSLANKPIFEAGESTDYVKEYIMILNTGINFSEFELEQYIRKLTGKIINITDDYKCPKCGKTNEKSAKFCYFCGNQLLIDKVRKDAVYQPIPEKENISLKVSESGKSGTLVLGQTETTNDNQSETVVLGSEELVKRPVLCITRVKDGSKTFDKKDVFIIGKEADSTDLCISDNNVISRNHASIIYRDNQYAVVDQKSTNGTYLNDFKLTPLEPVLIEDQSRLKLANEEFVLTIQN